MTAELLVPPPPAADGRAEEVEVDGCVVWGLELGEVGVA